MTDNRIRICFIYISLSKFVKDDLEILNRHFDVVPVQWRGKRDVLKILKAVLKSDITFSWFVGDHSLTGVLFSKIFGKKSIIVTGGNDIIKIPEISINEDMKGKITKKVVFSFTDAIITFSMDGKKAVEKFNFNKYLDVVYLGIDTKKFIPRGEKENIAFTVGGGTEKNVIRKGIPIFVDAAKYSQEIKFIHAGKLPKQITESLKKRAAPNVLFLGFLSEEELIRNYQRAKVYVQVSRHEGFGLSMAEAMACGCIPVVTHEGAIPEVVGDAGFYVDRCDAETVAREIAMAMNSPKECQRRSRERIEKYFSMEKRERKLVKLIEGIISGDI